MRDKGKLIAMASERMRPGGWTEVSAVCTDPDHRGRGLARALTERLIDGIVERGERPFLHLVTENENALRLYSAMGFVIRRTAANSTYQRPESASHRQGRTWRRAWVSIRRRGRSPHGKRRIRSSPPWTDLTVGSLVGGKRSLIISHYAYEP
ncbi:GNAT family N-acetyltransferase [Streptosporangium lutulentum]